MLSGRLFFAANACAFVRLVVGAGGRSLVRGDTLQRNPLVRPGFDGIEYGGKRKAFLSQRILHTHWRANVNGARHDALSFEIES